MDAVDHLVWLDRSAAAVPLDRSIPLTIGRDAANRLCLTQEPGLSRHHAELRPGGVGQWLVCDLGSSNGTYVEGERLSGCRLLAPGDRIRLGRRGPWLQFLQGAPEPAAPPMAPSTLGDASPPSAFPPLPASDGALASPSRPAAARAVPPPAPGPGPVSAAPPSAAGVNPSREMLQPDPPAAPQAVSPAALEGTITVAGRALPLDQIRAVEVHSEALHPQVFSWWVLACLGGLLLLPFPLIFWPWQAAALALALLLGRRQEHILLLTLRDGRAHRHRFADRPAALAHRKGVRRALGQDPEA
ncbi:MAG: FHA domain-containing protein [Cyanobacteria bacterium]|nr:FHA domain-containing protein [Cyanobacteriota bacterium]